jgi:hypothetical protein
VPALKSLLGIRREERALRKFHPDEAKRGGSTQEGRGEESPRHLTPLPRGQVSGSFSKGIDCVFMHTPGISIPQTVIK